MRQNVFGIFRNNAFFFTAHQVNVELGYASGFKLLELLDMLFDRAKNAKPINDVVLDKAQMISVFIGVMAIVIPLTPFNVIGQALRNITATAGLWTTSYGRVCSLILPPPLSVVLPFAYSNAQLRKFVLH